MCEEGAQPASIIVSKQQNENQVWTYWTDWSWSTLGQTRQEKSLGWPHATKMTEAASKLRKGERQRRPFAMLLQAIGTALSSL